MSQYLTTSDTDYVGAGVELTIPLIIRASALIDGYCNREIGPKSYIERIPLTPEQRGHVTYSPVIEVLEASGRAATGLMGNYFGAPGFEPIHDLSVIDIDKRLGTIWCGCSPFGSVYAELEISYTSGWEVIPETVKVACGLLINQLTSNSNSNVKSKKDFDFSIEYFGNSMFTPEIADLLIEYRLLTYR